MPGKAIVDVVLRLPYVLIFIGLLAAYPSNAQRGKIIKPATTTVMDPNGDGFVSKSSTGFSNKGFNGYYVKEFEIPMFGIPIVGNGEAAADNQVGPKCGITDITLDSLGYGAYAVLDKSDNMIFRFRIGTDNPSVESYTILIDTDGKIGTDDPNQTPNNPGFEIDITLIKNSNKGVYIYNIDGIESCPTALRNYSFDSNFQIAIADVVTCSDPDYFYDFYVPFQALQDLFGITKNTELRFVALTNVSATCAMSGKISDVGGVDDALYNGCNTCAFIDLATNQCPTSLNNLCETCVGFQTGVTPKPTINTPVKAGEYTVSGTAVPSATVFVDLLDANRVLIQSLSTTTASSGCTACSWSVTFSSPLVSTNIVSARAKSNTGCQSGGVSSDATITIVVTNIPPALSGAAVAETYTENDPPLPVDATLEVTDPDNVNLVSLTATIISNYVSAEDRLTFTTVPGVTGSFNTATGVLTLTGNASVASYQTLARSVSYSNLSDNPSNATRTVRIVVNDGLDNSNAFDRMINVVPVNDPPVANPDAGTTNEDTPVTLPNITANDTDVDGTIDITTVDLNPLSVGIQTSFADAKGSWTVNASAQVTYTPALNYNGIASISYTVNDNLGAVSNSATITVTVLSVNDPPVAVNDAATTNEDTPVTLNVVANDTDVDGTVDPASVDLDTGTAGIQSSFTNASGSWSVNASGVVTYNPTLNFNGSAVLNYTVNDNNGATSNVASITITVTQVNDPPVANPDSGTTNEDTPVTLPNVTVNDTDVDGTIDITTVDLNPLSAGIQTNFSDAKGSWTVNATGQVTYTPALNFNGIASISYTVNDNSGATSNSTTITITVNSVNDPPVANDDSGLGFKDTPKTLSNVTANDTDVDGTVVASTVDLDPSTAGQQTTFPNANGTWSVNAQGDVTFTPNAGFVGTVTVQYTVQDNNGAVSNQATITITIQNITVGGDIPPVANNDTGSTNEDTPVTLPNITSNDTDADGTIDPSTVDLNPLVAGLQQSITTPEGTWSVNASGDLTYTPAPNYNGTAVISYTVNDNIGVNSNTANVTITVNAVNDPPVANSDTGTTNEDTPVTLPNITANDTDVDGTIDVTSVDLDPLSAGIQNNFSDAKGSWTVNASGQVTYSPVLNFNGVASISYTVNDNLGATSNSATITITVNPVNDPPVAANDATTTNEDTQVTLNIVTNDTDVDGTVDPASVDLNTGTAGIQNSFTNASGSWSVDASGVVTYNPALNFNGTAGLNYTVNDNSGATSNIASITITVLPVNDPPVANPDSGTTNEDTPVTLPNITANDTDVDGTIDVSSVDLDPTTAGVQSSFSDAKGTWSVNASGQVTYTPALNYNGVASISYAVNDNAGAISNSATITISVSPVNDPPVLNDIVISTFRNIAVSGSVLDPADLDPDGTPLTVNTTATNPPDHGTLVLQSNGSYTFTPLTNYVGIDVAEVQVCDNGIPLPPACSTKIININVQPQNRPPEILVKGIAGDSIAVTTLEDVPIVFCFEAIDPDGDNTVIQSINKVSGEGGLALYNNIKYCFQYTPKLNFNGTTKWYIQVCDDASPTSACVKFVAFITVVPVNDAPVAVRDSIRVLRRTPSSGNVLANDYDVESNLLTVTLPPVQNVLHGQMMMSADGSFTYTSDVNYRGLDSLKYQVCDNGTPSLCSVGTLIIFVDDLPLKVYQGVTPNGDGVNDFLRIDGIDYYENNEVMIFDRFNNLVFQMTGYNNEDRIWRGQANKGVGITDLPEETYFYNISLGDGGPPLKGYIYLKRN
ncbi:MAG: tandem-95 repeat protein [Bacteroidetes bacterium]|nr:tandem-95 repeat protein [Bacteroidota bacterium]